MFHFPYPAASPGATMNSARGFAPGRLRSLWDMLDDARDFVTLTQVIEELWHYADESDRQGNYERQTAYVAGRLSFAADIAADLSFPGVAAQIRRISDLIETDNYG